MNAQTLLLTIGSFSDKESSKLKNAYLTLDELKKLEQNTVMPKRLIKKAIKIQEILIKKMS